MGKVFGIYWGYNVEGFIGLYESVLVLGIGRVGGFIDIIGKRRRGGGRIC